MPAGGMAAHEDPRRVPAERACVFQHKGHTITGVFKATRKYMLRRQSVTNARERNSSLNECRRHERHPFLITVGPSATMDERERGAIRFFSAPNCDALIGIGTV
jgi:hypothetical protein